MKKYILLYEISIGRGGGRAWRSLRNSQSCLEAGATVDQNKQKDKKVADVDKNKFKHKHSLKAVAVVDKQSFLLLTKNKFKHKKIRNVWRPMVLLTKAFYTPVNSWLDKMQTLGRESI